MTRLRIQALRDLLRMGHCAPAVVPTLCRNSGIREDRLVRLVSGMPGGDAAERPGRIL